MAREYARLAIWRAVAEWKARLAIWRAVAEWKARLTIWLAVVGEMEMRLEKREVTLNEKDTLLDMALFEECLQEHIINNLSVWRSLLRTLS